MTQYATVTSVALLLTLAACDEQEEAPTTTLPETDSGEPPFEVSVFGAIVRGSLYTTDMDEAQIAHDAVAAGGQPIAVELGDLSHDVLLGTDILDSTPDRFLAVDRWDDLAGMQDFFSNPDVAAGFASLFGEPPSIDTFERRDDWYGWGDLDAAEDGPRWFALVQGTLAGTDAEARAVHDQVAAGGQAAAEPAGDVAHVVFTGLENPSAFLAIDVWTSDAAIEAVYTDPAFQDAFGAVFASPPTIEVYASTDWHQW